MLFTYAWPKYACSNSNSIYVYLVVGEKEQFLAQRYITFLYANNTMLHFIYPIAEAWLIVFLVCGWEIFFQWKYLYGITYYVHTGFQFSASPVYKN
jgi:hypothetical protein